MNARSALFDLFGDHLRRRPDGFADRAPVSALVRLLEPLGVTAPAVRTAISRMVRQGWLLPVRLPAGPGYALTPRAIRRLDETAARVYRTAAPAGWDGRWRLVVVLTQPPDRAGRDRLAGGLSFLGYGALDMATWLSPHPRATRELDALLAAEGAQAERFTATHDGDSLGLLTRAWDLEGIARSYLRFMTDADGIVRSAAAGGHRTAGLHGRADSGRAQRAFVARTRLVHAWRKFLFVDPGLPAALLPPDWPGERAAALFDAEADRLLPAATRFVDSCLPPQPASTRTEEAPAG